jgi:SnoaL-like domain
MSEENVEIARKLADLWNTFMQAELSPAEAAEAAAQLVQLFDPQVEQIWHDRRTMPDQPQRLRGVAELLRFWEQMRGAWLELKLEPLELIEAPDGRVLTLIRQSAQGRESGVPIVFHSFLVLTIRRGRMRKVELFRHRAEALEAAGLRE